MARTVIGIFQTTEDAEGVIQDLIKAGIDRDSISIIARQPQPKDTTGNTEANSSGHKDEASKATAGAVWGGVGGLVLGLAVLAVPGIGPIAAVGPLAAALTGAGVGAASGAVVGALTEFGIPQHDAQFYSEALEEGRTLLTLRCDDTLSDPAMAAMNQHGASAVEERAVYHEDESDRRVRSYPFTIDE